MAGSGDFTAAELAAFDLEARRYTDDVRRRRVTLTMPSAGLNHGLAYGQSLSSGWESWPALTRTSPPDCFMLGLSVHSTSETLPSWAPVGGSSALTPLIATVRNSTTGLLSDAQVAALSFGSLNRGETPMESFAAQYRRAWLLARGKPDGDPDNRWVFSSCGVGGNSVAQLSQGASPELFNRLRDAIAVGKARAATLSVTYRVPFVLINHGEEDYALGTTFADYVTRKTQLITDIRALVASETGQPGILPIYLFQTGGQYARDTLELAIARAQIEVARSVPGVFIVANNQLVPDKDDHLTSNGTRWLGSLAGKVAARTTIQGEGWECTRAIRWTVRGRTLVGLFHAPSGALQFVQPYIGRAVAAAASATSRGIYAADGAGQVGIDGVELAGQLVIVRLGRAVSGTLKVWLGRDGNGVGGAICIGDTDAEPILLPYSYTAGSGQTTDEDIAALVNLAYPSTNVALADVQTATAA